MNDLAIAVAVRNSLLRQDNNLRIAKREEIGPNTPVELSCSQTDRQKLPVKWAGGIAP
jgi:hypothetical protein